MPEHASIAVVGTGWWATTAHLPAMKAHDRIGKTILVDSKLEAAQAAAHKYGIPLDHCYTSIAEAKAAHPDLQGAIVATTHHAHYASASACLDQGLHLLLEKPMTIYARDAKALVDQAAAANLNILMGYTFPYLPPVAQAKRYIDDGLIGDVEYVACSMSSVTYDLLLGYPERFEPATGFAVTGPAPQTYSEPTVAGGGQGVLQITHLAAMMFHLASGMRAEIVTAFMHNLQAKVDVIDAMAVRMNTGALATVGSSGNLRPGDPGSVEVHLHGSKGRIRVDGFTGEFFMHLHSGRQEHIPRHNPTYPGDIPVSKFVELLLDDAEPLFPGSIDGLYSVELLEAAARSAAREGQPVLVHDLYE
jgi:predicted dehydrogenase